MKKSLDKRQFTAAVDGGFELTSRSLRIISNGSPRGTRVYVKDAQGGWHAMTSVASVIVAISAQGIKAKVTQMILPKREQGLTL